MNIQCKASRCGPASGGNAVKGYKEDQCRSL